MDASKMKYPYGRCANCGREFTAELRKQHHITYCPWCGDKIDDHMTDENYTPERKNDIYCENCGRRIYERIGKGGDYIDHTAGVCSGHCERELCGQCGDWDYEGCCEKCHGYYEVCDRCPKEDCHENPEVCKNPCLGCSLKYDCVTENTDKRHECQAYTMFLGAQNG